MPLFRKKRGRKKELYLSPPAEERKGETDHTHLPFSFTKQKFLGGEKKGNMVFVQPPSSWEKRKGKFEQASSKSREYRRRSSPSFSEGEKGREKGP